LKNLWQNRKNEILILIISLLIAPALFINLGLFPLSADEATRGIVALEMKYSGNIITPTINGEFYFNKPPLYNWILLGIFNLSGSQSNFMVRLPAVISLLLLSLTIFIFVKRYSDKNVAFFSAMAFLTCGRILFYDSMLGLIDLTYSWLLLLNLMLIFHWLSRKKYLVVFLVSYFIASMAFLMKGLPAIAFQGLTIAAAFIFFKKAKKLFSFHHLLGIIVFIIITGSYYFLLWQQNPDTSYFTIMLHESTKRTFLEYGWHKTFIHLFTFPIEQLYHLLPWSIFFIFFFRPSFYQHIRENKFLSFLAFVFAVNIPIYWISVETYPRYLFMLYPIPLIISIHYYHSLKWNDLFKNIFDKTLLVAAILLIPAGVYFYFSYPFHVDKLLTETFIMVFGALIIFIFLFLKFPAQKLAFFIIFLLILRIGFNLIIIPERYVESRRTIQMNQAIKVGKLSKNRELWLGEITPLSIESIFYITREREEIFFVDANIYQINKLYIFYDSKPALPNEKVLYKFESRWENTPMRLSEFLPKEE
jgi:4-amino-4-deoxy-L-arabinose transferase-like glycosyltransferase